MTSEDSEEPKATTESSGIASGEERSDDPRDAAEPEATTASSEPPDGDSDAPSEPESGDDIPLNIVGHEERDPPGGPDAAAFDFDDGGGEESSTVGEETSAGTGATGESESTDDAADLVGADAADLVDADAAGDSADDEDVQPVELLVQLAKNGEIDPWDIDIVHVTDKFLAALDEADLRTSGRALFYASVLLRMKSDVLFSSDEPDEEELPPWEAPFSGEGAPADGDGAPGFDPVERLEAEMERRLDRKHARGKPETLDELVRELREAERGSWWKRSRSYDTSGSPRGFNRGVQELSYHSGDAYRGVDEPTADDVTHTQHAEDIEDVIAEVEDALEPHYEAGREEVLFAEIEGAGGSRVMTYLALLFLAHRGRVRLEQDELFGDLWIQQVTVEAEPSEALAD
ncbi:segregation/condensation protein A [Halovivax sp.]|uniref:segregation/condensation protein A n=1 Tax=Halovivax sp. TaxID=1935978 RepID=UPI0025C5BD3F|nr:ScpA family protein [Halovivax sp.]